MRPDRARQECAVEEGPDGGAEGVSERVTAEKSWGTATVPEFQPLSQPATLVIYAQHLLHHYASVLRECRATSGRNLYDDRGGYDRTLSAHDGFRRKAAQWYRRAWAENRAFCKSPGYCA